MKTPRELGRYSSSLFPLIAWSVLSISAGPPAKGATDRNDIGQVPGDSITTSTTATVSPATAHAGSKMDESVGPPYANLVSSNLVVWSLPTNTVLESKSAVVMDAGTGKNPRRLYQVGPPNDVTFIAPANMVAIEPGTFLMGSPTAEPERDSDEDPQTTVTISKRFWLGKYEVTQREYQEVVGSNPSHFKGDLDLPVEQVSWNDATNYCGKLTAREWAAGRLPAGYEYRLPTEAQWEYACRAGTTTATAFGDSLSSTQANFDGTNPYNGGASALYLEKTTKVGSYVANAWGLYDMHGNIWEWCQDWWYGDYPGGSVTDPKGGASGSHRVSRGGSWYRRGRYCRSANRDGDYPDDHYNNLGFRAALVAVDDPSIFGVLMNRIALIGSSTQFEADTGGTVPLFYQWHLGGKPLVGETKATLNLHDIQSSQAGLYSVVVSNSLGVATRSDLSLTVYSVSTSLSSQEAGVVPERDSVTFSVSATHPLPLTYRWTKDGTTLPGQTGSVLTLRDVQVADGGSYSVVISDGATSATAVAGSFRVVPAPPTVLLSQGVGGGSAQLSVHGSIGSPYTISVSSNLVVWSYLTNMVMESKSAVVMDAGAGKNPWRFYRVGPPNEGTSTVPANMVAIQPGTFLMGSPASERDRGWLDDPQMTVTIGKGFWLGKYEVTQGEYQDVMGVNPSNHNGDLNLPVETVSWNDATNYCGKLTARERAAGRLPAGYEYRLPTEAQWEYACRAGTTTATAFGDSLSSTQANFNGGYPYNGGAEGPYLNKTTKVGSYAANAWGLHDMHGNVWEWCQDRYSEDAEVRMWRGGSWSSDGGDCRSASRNWCCTDGGFRILPAIPHGGLGFRAALVQVP